MKKLYTPTQIALATYLAGPFAAIFFLKRNFEALGKETFARKTLRIGLLLSFLLLIIQPFLAEVAPGVVLPVLYLVPVIMVVKNHQMTKDEIRNSDDYVFQSSWKVFGMGIILMLAFYVMAIIFMIILESLGLIRLTWP